MYILPNLVNLINLKYITRTTPSAKYEARQTRGEVVAAYGISQGTGITWKGSGNKVSVRHFDGVSNVQSSYKYMFQKLQDKANGKIDINIHSS